MLGGLLSLPFWNLNLLNRWLEPVLPPTIAPEPHVDTAVKVGLDPGHRRSSASSAIILAFIPWLRSAEHPALEPAVLEHAWYYDDEVSAFVRRTSDRGGRLRRL